MGNQVLFGTAAGTLIGVASVPLLLTRTVMTSVSLPALLETTAFCAAAGAVGGAAIGGAKAWNESGHDIGQTANGALKGAAVGACVGACIVPAFALACAVPAIPAAIKAQGILVSGAALLGGSAGAVAGAGIERVQNETGQFGALTARTSHQANARANSAAIATSQQPDILKGLADKVKGNMPNLHVQDHLESDVKHGVQSFLKNHGINIPKLF